LKNETDELEDMLADLDPPYESMEEHKIGRMLDQYGIPFLYKQATIIYKGGRNEIWKPSFTLYSYDGAVIDYIATGQEIPQKEEVYKYNQMSAVVLGPKDLDEPHWEQRLYEKLEQMYRQPFDLMQYAPMHRQE